MVVNFSLIELNVSIKVLHLIGKGIVHHGTGLERKVNFIVILTVILLKVGKDLVI